MDRVSLTEGRRRQLSAIFDLPEGRPGRRTELPPSEACQECDRLWADLKALETFRKMRRASVKARIDTLDAAERATKRFRVAADELCPLRSRILDSKDATDNVPNYSWTATWETYKDLEKVLSSPDLQEFCK